MISVQSSINTLFEIELYNKRILTQLDDLFAQLKQDPKNIKIHKQIENIIKKLTGAKIVGFFVIKQKNAFVIPIYDRELPSILELIVKNKKNITKAAIKDTISNHINELYFAIGTPLIKALQPREITAVFLHEVGHVYFHGANFFYKFLAFLRKTNHVFGNNIITDLMKKSIKKSDKKSLLEKSLKYLIPILFPLGFTAIITLGLLTNRSLTFLGHMMEYDADEFPTKLGYGLEIINVLKKFRDKKPKFEVDDGIINKILYKLIILSGTSQSHPKMKERICNIVNKISNKYIDRYKDYKDVLEPIIHKYEKQCTQ